MSGRVDDGAGPERFRFIPASQEVAARASLEKTDAHTLPTVGEFFDDISFDDRSHRSQHPIEDLLRQVPQVVGLVLAVVGRTGDVSFAACGGNAEIVSRSDVANPQCVGLCRKTGPFDPTVAARARSRGASPEVVVGKIVHHFPFEPLPHRPHSPGNPERPGTQTRLFQQCGIASHVERQSRYMISGRLQQSDGGEAVYSAAETQQYPIILHKLLSS